LERSNSEGKQNPQKNFSREEMQDPFVSFKREVEQSVAMAGSLHHNYRGLLHKVTPALTMSSSGQPQS